MADEIIELLKTRDVYVATVVMIEMLHQESRSRGQRLMKGIIDDLVEVLAREPENYPDLFSSPSLRRTGAGRCRRVPSVMLRWPVSDEPYEDHGFERLGG